MTVLHWQHTIQAATHKLCGLEIELSPHSIFSQASTQTLMFSTNRRRPSHVIWQVQCYVWVISCVAVNASFERVRNYSQAATVTHRGCCLLELYSHKFTNTVRPWCESGCYFKGLYKPLSWTTHVSYWFQNSCLWVWDDKYVCLYASTPPGIPKERKIKRGGKHTAKLSCILSDVFFLSPRNSALICPFIVLHSEAPSATLHNNALVLCS